VPELSCELFNFRITSEYICTAATWVQFYKEEGKEPETPSYCPPNQAHISQNEYS